MIVYHGSYLEIPEPDLCHSRNTVDFGRGFYTTPIYEQAVKWCGRFVRRGQNGIISYYDFDETAYGHLNILQFDAYSDEWLDFVLSCRNGQDHSNYDIVTGGVANDKVFNAVELYFDHLIDKTEAIRRLRFEKPNMQICFRTQKAIDNYLHFKGSEQI